MRYSIQNIENENFALIAINNTDCVIIESDQLVG